MSSDQGHNFIAGQRSAQGSVQMNSLDATTGEALPHPFVQATEAQVDTAAKAAAFAVHRSLPTEQRAQFLDAIADEPDALGEEFVATGCRETVQRLPAGWVQTRAVCFSLTSTGDASAK